MRIAMLIALITLLVLPARALGAEAEVLVGDASQQAATELERGNFAAAAGLLDQALADPAMPPDRRASILNDRGVANWRLNRLKEAVADFNEAARLLPEFAAVYNNRGNVLLALNSADEAVRDFDRAILLAPSYVAAFNNRAIAHMQQGNNDEAAIDFAKAAELSPTAPAPINGRGRAELASGHLYAAMRSFSRSISLDPTYKAGYRNRAEVLLTLAKPEEAVEDLSSALGFAPDDPGLLLTRGRGYLEVKAFGPALQDFSRAIEIEPKSALAYAERGRAYARIEEFERALADFGMAIELDSRNAYAFTGRAAAHNAMRAPELGLADVERALKLDPQNGEAYRVRGDLSETLGNQAAAVADFRQAAAIATDDDLAWQAIERLTGEQRPQPIEVAGTEFEDWSVFVEPSGRYFASSSRIRKLQVALEVFGQEAPRITDFEQMTGAYKGIALLRYRAGRVEADRGSEEVELAAIIDINNRRLIGLEPYRQGERLANWTWDEENGTVVVRGPDGITSEHKLRGGRPKPGLLEEGTSAAQGQSFDDFWFGTSTRSGNQSRQKQVATQKRRSKPKTLFDLLFQ